MTAIVPSFQPARMTMYQSNTQLVQIYGLRDRDGNFVSTATITATLLDQNRTEVEGCIDVVMSYEPGSNGDYTGVVTAAFKPAVGSEYTMVLDGDSGPAHLHVEIPTQVTVRDK